MRKVILFIAMSLDGYIADQNGKVDWLAGEGKEDPIDAYSEFVEQIDTVLMGWKTYDQVKNELSPDRWVYQDLTTYVFTHRTLPNEETIYFIEKEPTRFLESLKNKEGKDIWICGGARLVHQLIMYGQIDRYIISTIPILLGKGIRLFPELERPLPLSLVGTRHYDGIVEMVYEPR